MLVSLDYSLEIMCVSGGRSARPGGKPLISHSTMESFLMNIINKMAASAIAIAAVAAAANAQSVITQSGSFTNQPISTNTTLSFNQFDLAGLQAANPDAIVTLNSVTLVQTGNYNVFGSVTNRDATAAILTVDYTYRIRENFPGGATNLVEFTNPSGFGNTEVVAVGTAAPNQTLPFNISANLNSNVTFTTPNAFVGAGTFSVLFATTGIAAGGGAANVDSSITQRFSKSLTLNYNYSVVPRQTGGVPEPSAVAFAAIAGSGLVGMMIRARRK